MNRDIHTLLTEVNDSYIQLRSPLAETAGPLRAHHMTY